MNSINWKQKLTSRKFWAAIIGFATAVMMGCNISNLTIEQVISIISACSVLIAYIIGEGLVDSARISQPLQETLSGETSFSHAKKLGDQL